jgi:cation diffusion facilitator CzcD-associated flavoprotein CzcO
MKLPRVVIVGAGFGGIAAAKALARAPVDVTIVDQHNFHTFSPLLYQVATAAPRSRWRPTSSGARYDSTRVIVGTPVPVRRAGVGHGSPRRAHRFSRTISTTRFL